MRKGLEALTIALYRQESGRSPTVSFGRMPRGYRMSSANNTKLIATNRRFRGRLAEAAEDSWAPGIAPLVPLTGDPRGPEWCQHRWSPWMPLREVQAHLQAEAQGLYRIGPKNDPGLVYVGEGNVRDRLRAHQAKIGRDHRQACILAEAGRLECSWVLSEHWLPHQRLELENDLIAAHVIMGKPPTAQFLG
jgi:hypothetical protein